MSKNNTPTGWVGWNRAVMELPTIEHPYVYLKVLETSQGRIPSNHFKHTKARAEQQFNTSFVHFTKENNNFKDNRAVQMIDFLKKAKNHFRMNEEQFLKSQLQNLKNQAQNVKDPNFVNLINLLEQSPEQINFLQITTLINAALLSIKQLRTRVRDLIDQNFKTKYMSEAKRNLIENLSSIQRNFDHAREKFYYSQEEVIRQLTMSFFQTSKVMNYFSNLGTNALQAERYVTISAALQQMIADYIYNNDLIQYGKNKKSHGNNNGLTDFYENEADMIQSYNQLKQALDQNNFFDQAFEKLTNDNVIKELEELYGINIDHYAQYSTRKNKNFAQINQELQDLEDKIGTSGRSFMRQGARDMVKRVKINLSTQGSGSSSRKISLANEISSILSEKVGAGTVLHSTHATDSLFSITLQGDITTELNSNSTDIAVQNIFDNIKKRIKDVNIDRSSTEEISKIYNEELEKLDRALNNLEKAFIFHETTKYYTTVEQGRWAYGRGFSGVTMALIRYIDQMSSFAQGLGIDANWLEFATINMVGGAIGEDSVTEMSNILLTAAGFLMFDDFDIMAKEIIDGFQYTNITNIHLYRLQDTYYPASVFLEAIIYQLNGALENIDSPSALEGMGFDIELSLPSIEYSIGNYQPEDWEDIKNNALENSKIKLSFAASFFDFLSKLP